MDETRKPRIAPASGGSFTSREKILDNIQEDKLRALETSQADAKKAKAESEKKSRLDAIDKLLPSDVNASFGNLPFNIFKERFQTVWDQVAEKTHLSRGYCDYSFEAAPNLQVTIRSLKSGEMKFLRRFTPATNPSEDAATYMDEDTLFCNVRFAIAVSNFDGNHLPSISVPKRRLLTKEDTDAWLDDPDVRSRLDWVDDLPEELKDFIAGVFVDLTIAYRFALQENLKNQFAPPSHS